MVGTTTALQTAAFTIWGWHTDGTAQKLLTYSVILGSLATHDFTNPLIWRDPDIRTKLTGAPLEVDTYTEDYDVQAIGTPSTQNVNGPNYVDVDLTNQQCTGLQMVTV